MQGSMAAVSLLTLLLLTAIPITLGSQTDPSSGLVQKPEKRVELSPAPKSPPLNTSASSKLQDTLLGSQLTPRVALSGGPYQPTECCLKFTTRVLPHRVIVTYYKTSSQCTKPGIIFITKKGCLVCANPRDSWVQPYVKRLQK